MRLSVHMHAQKRHAGHRCLNAACKPVGGLPLQPQGLELGDICEVVLYKSQLDVAALQE